MKILYCSSEVQPFAKTGGLADVAGSLPIALAGFCHEIIVVMPGYLDIFSKISSFETLSTFKVHHFHITIIETLLPGSQVKCWLVCNHALFERHGGPYEDIHGDEWHDNALRFSIFCQAVTEVAMNRAHLNWQPDIVHCNDWQTGVVPALLKFQDNRPKTVFTIHNLSYQGNYDASLFAHLLLPDFLWNTDGMEFYQQFSFIKGGLQFADIITTVSPTYADEICTTEFGCGFDGLLSYRKKDLYGILNGLDQAVWNPETDSFLKHHYNIDHLAGKKANKKACQRYFDLPEEDVPLLAYIGRLVHQKGVDILILSLEKMLTNAFPLQCVVLGSGDTYLQYKLRELSMHYPDYFATYIGYKEDLAHLIEAGADIFIMPSRFEPCGLNQLYSLKYGTLPVVTNTGGLSDTVVNTHAESLAKRTANGFVIPNLSALQLESTLYYALNCYQQKSIWQRLLSSAMTCDFSWRHSAEEYVRLYTQLLTLVRNAYGKF